MVITAPIRTVRKPAIAALVAPRKPASSYHDGIVFVTETVKPHAAMYMASQDLPRVSSTTDEAKCQDSRATWSETEVGNVTATVQTQRARAVTFEKPRLLHVRAILQVYIVTIAPLGRREVRSVNEALLIQTDFI